jgi:alpha-tubulin suppressor-like RCC1 family protein
MKRFLLALPVLATVFMACQQQPNLIQKDVLGSLEVNIDTTGVSSARFSRGLQTQGTLREADVTFPLSPQPIAAVITDGAYDYLNVQFPIQNTSLTPFDNLTLYAVAKAGNIGGTAIKSIANFGGISTSPEQTRVAKLITPTHGLQFTTLSGSSVQVPTMITNREDFQAFEETNEINTLQTDFNNNLSGFSGADKALGYGFVARRCLPNCTSPTSFARDLPAGNTNGLITIALRIPKQLGAITTYSFRMTFAVVNETTTRVTRGLYPPETLASAEGRQASGEVMQIGLSRAASQSSRTNKGIDQVVVSSDPTNGNASYTALGLGRLSSSGAHTCALTASGVAYCWGQGANGILGNNDVANKSLPVQVLDLNGNPSPLRFSSISAGSVNTCALTIDGVAYCWGNAASGRLGNGLITPNQTTPVKVQDLNGDSPLRFSSISTGNFTCALTTDGVAYCWGNGTSGQLGNNAASNQLLPVQVLDSGGNPNTLRFSSISAGSAHTCALTPAGVAYCWGRAINGELGNFTDTVNKNFPVIVKDATGNPSALRFSSISVGSSHTCGLTTTNVAYCWGSAFQGQLGDGQSGNTAVDRNTPVAVAVSLNNPSALRFSSISAGGSHTCALTTSGVAYCWGLSSNGKLGNNDLAIANYSLPVKVLTSLSADSPLRFSSINAASSHSCALTTDGMSYCWGNAALGRLGDGQDLTQTVTNQPIPVRATASFKL